eukprot:10080024-Lingulodinium_polyedra.AAC.1
MLSCIARSPGCLAFVPGARELSHRCAALLARWHASPSCWVRWRTWLCPSNTSLTATGASHVHACVHARASAY